MIVKGIKLARKAGNLHWLIIDQLIGVNEILDNLKLEGLNRTPFKQADGKLDIVVTIATGYQNVDQYRQFISTLRRSGASCPVFIGIYDGPEYEPVKKYLLENAVNYFIVPPITPGNKVVNGYRFEQYRQWLGGLEFRYALMMDFRDAYFQRDPFTDVEHYMRDCDLYLMSEFMLLTVGNHPNGMNYTWVADAFGKPAADAISDQAILNSGAILGNKVAVMKFLNEMASVTSNQNYKFADQGTLNYLTYSRRLDHCGRIKITRAGFSLVNNCGFTEIDLLRKHRPITREEEAEISFIPRDETGRLKLYRNNEGWVLDDNGEISYVVHQYDRFLPEIDDFVSGLSDFQWPDHVFINSKNLTYAGEKYILFSGSELKPGAIHLLVQKIKTLPVNKKPLLLVDMKFKHSFIFAYGTLHNELLFESETVRLELFQETTDSVKCDLFCRKWDYEPVFVEQDDIFAGSNVSG